MLVNEQINLEVVNVVVDGKLVSMSIEKALDMAYNNNEDLMLVQEDKGICKFGDYSKLKYEQKKAKKNNSKTEVKEVQLSPNIAAHDLQVKADTINRLLAKGNTKVRIVMKFRGRMNMFVEQGRQLMAAFVNDNGWVLEKPIDHKDSISSCVVSKR